MESTILCGITATAWTVSSMRPHLLTRTNGQYRLQWQWQQRWQLPRWEHAIYYWTTRRYTSHTLDKDSSTENFTQTNHINNMTDTFTGTTNGVSFPVTSLPTGQQPPAYLPVPVSAEFQHIALLSALSSQKAQLIQKFLHFNNNANQIPQWTTRGWQALQDSPLSCQH